MPGFGVSRRTKLKVWGFQKNLPPTKCLVRIKPLFMLLFVASVIFFGNCFSSPSVDFPPFQEAIMCVEGWNENPVPFLSTHKGVWLIMGPLFAHPFPSVFTRAWETKRRSEPQIKFRWNFIFFPFETFSTSLWKPLWDLSCFSLLHTFSLSCLVFFRSCEGKKNIPRIIILRVQYLISLFEQQIITVYQF